MDQTEHCWGCGDHQPPMCEEKKRTIEKELVFCSECKHCERMKFRDWYKTICISPLNKREVITFYERRFVTTDRPSQINKNNDCKWFERKECVKHGSYYKTN